jgi:hypothetical protein
LGKDGFYSILRSAAADFARRKRGSKEMIFGTVRFSLKKGLCTLQIQKAIDGGTEVKVPAPTLAESGCELLARSR